MKKVLSVVAVLAVVFLAAGTASADTFNPVNTQVRTINPSPGGEANLGYLVDRIFLGSGNTAYHGLPQNLAGMWGVATGAYSVNPALQAVYTGNGNVVGIWSVSGDTMTRVDIFKPGPDLDSSWTAPPYPVQANLVWDKWTGQFAVGSTGACGLVNCVSGITGINPFAFGFYLKTGPNSYYYTVDALNDGVARSVAFQHETNWAFGFEDGSDFDYNDAVFSVESLQPVPEPGSMLLLGSGLLGLAGAVRRRMKK